MRHKVFNYRPLIRSAARKIWMWSPMRKEAIANARLPGRPYRVGCAICGMAMRESVKPPLFAVDHIVPASEPSALIHNWNNFFDRLFVPASENQVLCHPCHNSKTARENASRVKPKKAARRRRKRQRSKRG